MKTLVLLIAAAGMLAPAFAPAAECAPRPGVICADDREIDEAAMLARLRAASVVVLGERHDNPEHHEWQARIVAALAPKGLAFEMVPRAKEEAANAARAEGEDLGEALQWAKSGWPDWAMYAPIFEAAPHARIAGGGVEREMLVRAVKEGAAAAFGDDAARYGLGTLPESVERDMREEQARAHCSALPYSLLPGMAEAQQLRDAAFADAVLRLVESGHAPAVLIAGDGHARMDRGAPFYLRRAAPGMTALSVGAIEAGETVEDYSIYDIAIFTAPMEREDPCGKFIHKRRKN